MLRMSSTAPSPRRNLLARQYTPALSPTGVMVRKVAGGRAEARRELAVPLAKSERLLPEPLEPFFEACGGRQTIALSVARRDSASPPEMVVFHQPFVLIGRCHESDLTLADDYVNFRHFYLQFLGGRWVIVNLSNVAGLAFENGKAPWGWFDLGCEIPIGRFAIARVAAGWESLTGSPSPGSDASPFDRPSFELEFLNGGNGSQSPLVLRFTAQMTLIGASRRCGVCLNDKSVSKVHASLVSTPNGLWVVDLLGRGGVLVDDHPAFWGQIHEGSILQIGRFRLRVRFDAARTTVARNRWEHAARHDLLARQPAPSASGGLSEGAVMALVKQMADMQAQFFEHSQFQMRLITEMLAHLGGAQPTSIRQELARIDDIGRELEEIKAQLARPAEVTTIYPDNRQRSSENERGSISRRRPLLETTAVPCAESNRPSAAPRPLTINPNEPGRSEPRRQKSPAPTVVPPEAVRSSAPDPPQNSSDEHQGGTQPAPATADAHALLSQRMARLAQERKSRWSRILSAFSRQAD